MYGVSCYYHLIYDDSLLIQFICVSFCFSFEKVKKIGKEKTTTQKLSTDTLKRNKYKSGKFYNSARGSKYMKKKKPEQMMKDENNKERESNCPYEFFPLLFFDFVTKRLQ